MVCSFLCSLHLFPKYLILAVQLKKKTTTTTMRSDNAAVSGSIADRFNFMSDCEQMQVRLINGKAVHQPKAKKISGKQVADWV